MHFAAHTIAPESVDDPLKYYGNNTANSRILLECCAKHDVKHFVFSSTAAVYGIPSNGKASETTTTQPIISEKIKHVLGWQPKFDDLETIVRTSLEWERKIAAKDSSAYWKV